jgi:predicted ester cyclase
MTRHVCCKTNPTKNKLERLTPTLMNQLEHLKHITTQLLEQGNLDIVDTAFSADYIAHAGDKAHTGQKFVKQFVKQVRKAIPDLKIVKIEILSEADNVITWQRSFSGTHKAALQGIPASNNKVKWYEIVVTRFDKDKIIEEWLASDLAFQLMLKLK